ncbi:MAG: hypothetical protein JO083_11725 [Candidatus Eremiobacteraeota bacterium]|nr:hypothetical protein [Candidatus Eremiobacteraeota bacterium]
MMLAAAATPPACHASIAAYYAPDRKRPGFHTVVVTDDDYALVGWYDEHSGGQGAFRRRHRRWCVLVNSGGAFRADELVRYGVPRPHAERLLAKMQRLRR